jgi:DNA end-binding protein Ku
VQLVESLAADFEPHKYSDQYREEVLALIERKAQGEQIAVQPSAEEVAEPAPDLMSALKASLEAVRAREGESARAGAKARKPAAGKRAPAKPRSGAKAPASKAPAKASGAKAKAKAGSARR